MGAYSFILMLGGGIVIVPVLIAVAIADTVSDLADKRTPRR